MKIAVCDDNARDMAQIKNVFEKMKGPFDLDVHYYSSGEEFLSDAPNNTDLSLAVLDIYMKELDGMQTTRRLKEIMPKAETAFLTTSSEFAIDAFGIDALHYIIKPVSKEKIQELMERFFARTHSAIGNFELKCRKKTYTFPMLQVRKLASSNKGVDVYLKNGDIVHVHGSFASVEEQLDAAVFLKVSRGLIVNMSYILYMNNEICRFKDGTESLISRRERSEIRRRYNDYLFDGQEGAIWAYGN